MSPPLAKSRCSVSNACNFVSFAREMLDMACIADLIDVDRKVVRPHAVRAAGVSGAVAVSALAMIRPDILHGAEREVGHHGRPAMLVWRRAPAACQGRERGVP